MSEVDYAIYEQVQSERDITGDNFTKGQINYIWDCQGPKKCNLYRSYFRVRCKLTKGDGTTQLDKNDGIAPNMFCLDNIVQQMNHQINGKQVDEIQDYIPQLSALKKRIHYNESMLESLGSKTMFSQPNIHERINEVSSDGFNYKKEYIEEILHPGNQASRISSLGALVEGQANLGYAAGDRFAVAVNTGVITFDDGAAGATGQDARLIFNIGDTIIYSNQATNILRQGTVIAITGVDSITIRQDQAILVSALQTLVAGSFSRISSTRSLITGENTLFETELQLGDEIEYVNGDRHKVVRIISDTQIEVIPKISQSFALTADWRRIRKKPSRRVDEFELIWKPPMGIWDLDEWICGKQKLEITPHSSSVFQQYAIESLVNKTSAGNNPDFKFEIVDMLLYVYMGHTNKSYSGSKQYMFSACRAQSQALTTNSLTDKTFIVNPNTHSLTVFYQDERASDSSETIYSRSKFKIEADRELNLTRYYIKYHGHFLPNPSADPSYVSGDAKDHTTQNYYEMLMYSGSGLLKSDIEDLNRWQERGPFYHYKWPKSVKESTERVYVSSQFSASFGVGRNPNVFLVDHFYRGFTLNIQNGIVKDVKPDLPPN